ncbi:hypothetical protein MNBD_NITROSPIRAE01-787 [hydrothermal vent metagenome]|uniref:Uncharacterized protein n=1 Tax=hydrothermal vent metagenome TaxID=652676 RepID=A0A3B1CEG4_9ZZZZ
MMDKKDKSQAAMALICFAVLSFVTALFFNVTTGELVRKALPPGGGIVGPMTIDSNRTVLQVKVSQDVPRNGPGNQVTGIVLDEQKNPLFSFGEEFWSETGYDDGGSWAEQKTAYDIKITLQKGTYFFELDSDSPAASQSKIHLLVKKKGGSAVPFFIAGIVALIIGVIMNEKANGTISRKITSVEGQSNPWA